MEFVARPKYPDPLEVFSQDDLRAIHDATLEILRTVGVRFYSERVLKLFKEHGAEVEFDSSMVRIGSDLVEQCMAKAPRSFSYYTQSFDEMKIGEGEFYVVSTVDNSYIIDPDTGKAREGRLSDVTDAARLMNELPFHHICGNAVIAHDIEPEMGVILSAVEMLKNNRKNCVVVVTNGFEAQCFIELGQAVIGPDVSLEERPIISVSVAPSSPLKFPGESCDVIWEFVTRKLPVIFVQAPMPGASSPVTIAGTMAQANAENLAAIVLAQLINEGNPVVYGGAAVHFDMRYSTPAYGAIEYGLLSIATAQMGRYYKLPTYGAGGATNANISDIQCGYEKMSSTMLAYLAGHDVMCDAGLNANALTSLESILIQDEILNKVTNLSKKIEVNDETIGLGVIRDASESGDFISHPHTLKYMKTDFSYDNIAGNREIYETWQQKGALDLEKVASKKAKELIENSDLEPLPDEVIKRIEEIVNRARNELHQK
jgi:trimethylamine--corrinoid protein Co-methyltransferase